MMEFIRVVEQEGGEEMEIPLETDGSLLLSTVQSSFPNCSGLKYRHPETGGWRVVRLVTDKFYPADINFGWEDVAYTAVIPQENKRKYEDAHDMGNKLKRMDKNQCTDLIVLGLPYSTTEQELRTYFQQFGDVLMAQVKKDGNNRSKGFGFIKMATYEAQLKVLSKRHMVEGRWCEVKIPLSRDGGGQTQVPCKVFVGRCGEEITPDDLRTYFCQFGEVTDVFIPKPFRAFAFVTFLDPNVAESLCGEDHLIKNSSVHVSTAAPKNYTRKGLGNNSQVGGWVGAGGNGDANYGGGSVDLQNLNPLVAAAVAQATAQASFGLQNMLQGGGRGQGGGYNQGGGNWNSQNDGSGKVTGGWVQESKAGGYGGGPGANRMY